MPIMPFNPYKHYWLAEDGRVYFSGSQTQMTDADPDYVAWVALGNAATTWPRDVAGVQTDAELQSVLAPYGMFVNLSYYSIDKRWRTEQAGITLTSGMPIETDDRAQAKISGAMLAAKYPPALTKAPPGGGGPAFTTEWHAADGTFWSLDAAAIAAMSGELQIHIDRCFTASRSVMDGIADGSVTTREQIDATFDGIVTARK